MLIGCKSGPCITCYCYGKGCIAGHGDDFWHQEYNMPELKNRLNKDNITAEETNELKRTIKLMKLAKQYATL